MPIGTINPPLLQFALLLWLLVMGTKVSTAAEFSPIAGSPTEADLKAMLRDYIDSDKLGVGLVVAMVDEHGKRIVSHGKLDNSTEANVDGDTLFEIGSVTKVFTGLLLQDMVDRGEMKLDDPVQKYLPKSVRMPTYQGKQITLLHLATHTSGFPREVDNFSPASWRNPGAGYTVSQAYDFLSHCKLRFEPGTKQRYSNFGVELLGHIIALKAGKDYETLVLERICLPLGMNSTRVAVPLELKSRLATGHALPGRSVPDFDCSVFPGGGGLRSTANDLLKFVSAYLGLAPSPLASLMQNAEAAHLVESGAKLRLAWWGEGTLFEHGGRTFGCSTKLAFDTGKRRGVVVLSNCGSSGIVDLLWQPLLEGRSRQPAGAVPVDAAIYNHYVGCYRTGEGENVCTIRREDERLLVRWIKPSGACYPGYEIFPMSNSAFSNSFWNTQLSFDCENTNQAGRLFLTDESHHLELTRFSSDVPAIPVPVQIDPAIYDRYAGRYRKTFLFGLVRLGPTFNIRHETDEYGDHLVGYITGKHIERYLPRLSDDLRGGEIFPLNETTFYSPLADDSFQVAFEHNKKGGVTGAAIRMSGSSIHIVRVSNHPLEE